MEHKHIFQASVSLAASVLIWILFAPIWDMKEWAIKGWMVRIWVAFDLLLLILLCVQCYLIYVKSRMLRNLSRFTFVLLIIDITLNLAVFFKGGLVSIASVPGMLACAFSLFYCAAIFLFYLNLEKENY